jgi:hypothetical protein
MQCDLMRARAQELKVTLVKHRKGDGVGAVVAHDAGDDSGTLTLKV